MFARIVRRGESSWWPTKVQWPLLLPACRFIGIITRPHLEQRVRLFRVCRVYSLILYMHFLSVFSGGHVRGTLVNILQPYTWHRIRGAFPKRFIIHILKARCKVPIRKLIKSPNRDPSCKAIMKCAVPGKLTLYIWIFAGINICLTVIKLKWKIKGPINLFSIKKFVKDDKLWKERNFILHFA